MKLALKAQEILDEKKAIAFEEIKEIFNQDDFDTYLIVLFNYFQVQKFMADYIEKNPYSIVSGESDLNIDEHDDSIDISMEVALDTFLKYGEVIQGMMISYNFKDRSFDEFGSMSIEELEREKELLKIRLVS